MPSLDTATAHSNPGANGPLLVVAHRCIDLSLLALFFLAPLVLGGRHPLGKLTLIVAALPGTIGVVIKVFSGRRLPLSNLHLLLLAGCMVVPLLQVNPVTPETVRQAAPGVQNLFGETTLRSADQNRHNTFSVSAVTTEKSLPLIVTYLCVFAFIVCRLESLADVEWLLTLLVGSALMLTIIALLQAAFGNGRFLWVYDHPSRLPRTVPRGPFQNENHLSSLLATMLPCMLYFLFRGADSKPSERMRTSARSSRSRSSGSPSWSLEDLLGGQAKRWMAAIGCVVIVITVYATPSRGGAAMIAFAAAVWVSALGWNWVGSCYIRRIGHAAWMRLGVGLGAFGSLLGIGTLFCIAEKYSYARAKLWAADFAIWQDFPVFGIGVGNHRHVYRAYLNEYFPDTFSTAESSMLQLLVETGAVGIALLIVVVCVIFWAVLRTVTSFAQGPLLLLSCALLAGLAASCVHASGDFPWHIPACFVVVMALAACAIRLPDIVKPLVSHAGVPGVPVTSTVSLVVVSVLMGGNVWAIFQAIPDARASLCWDAYRRLARESSEIKEEDSSELAMEMLRETLHHDPYHIQARTKLVYRMTSEFEHKRFQLEDPDRLAKEILAQAAVLARLCPTESRTYMCAAVASAALGTPPGQQQRLLEQSGRLRLVDGQVSLRRGLLALVLQDDRQATEHIERALNADPSFREHALKTLSMLFTPQQIVERFELSLDTLAAVYSVSLKRQAPEQQLFVGRSYCQRLWEHAERYDEPLEMDLHLLSAFNVASHIGDDAWKLKIVNKRLELFPRNVELLLARAEILHQLGALVEAQQDVNRCLEISPHDMRVRRFALKMDRDSRPSLR